jgi:hypothetical protein
MIAQSKKAVPFPPKARTLTVFAGSYIRLRDYQTSPSLTCPQLSRRNPPNHPPLENEEAVKGKKMVASYST